MFWFWYSLSPKDQKLWDCSTSNTFSPHQAKLWATELLGRWWRPLLLGSTRCRHARLLQSKCSKVGHGQPSEPMCPEDSISQWRAPPRVYRWWHTGLGLCKGGGGSAAEQKSSSDVDSQKKQKSYLASRDDLLVRKKKRCTDEAPFIMSQHKSRPRREEHGVWLLVVAGQP